LRILLDLIGLVWHLFSPQVSALFMSVAHLLLSRLLELASLWVVQFGCLYLVVGMYLFDFRSFVKKCITKSENNRSAVTGQAWSEFPVYLLLLLQKPGQRHIQLTYLSHSTKHSINTRLIFSPS